MNLKIAYMKLLVFTECNCDGQLITIHIVGLYSFTQTFTFILLFLYKHPYCIMCTKCML